MISFHRSGHDAHVANYTAVNVEHRIENERSQGFIRRFLRRRDALHNRFENFLDTNAHLRTCIDCFLRRDRKDFLQLPTHGRHISVWQIDLVNDRHNRESLFMRQMNVRHRLRFNSLCGIDHQQRTFTRRQ